MFSSILFSVGLVACVPGYWSVADWIRVSVYLSVADSYVPSGYVKDG
jgi:hypothetical protein